MSIIKDWFTEKDGQSFCPVRMLSVIGVIEYLVLAAHIAIATRTFDLQGFGTGLGITLAAAGASIAAKSATEK